MINNSSDRKQSAKELTADIPSPPKNLSILLIEDNRMDAELLLDVFRNEQDIHFEWEQTLSEGLKILKNKHIDMVLLDLNLPDSKGIKTFEQYQLKAPDTPVIILTGDDNNQQAVDAIRKGAQDYLIKQVWDASYLIPRSIRLSVERANIRKQLFSANKSLVTKYKELDQFVHMVSHDLMTPLNSIIGFGHLLDEEVDKYLCGGTEKCSFSYMKEYVQEILNTSMKMSGLIQDLLALAYAENSELKLEDVILADCFAVAIKMLNQNIRETDAQIECDLLPDVKGDNHLLNQLFLNLISNAIKYVDNKIPKIQVTHDIVDNRSIIGVKDNGIGIKSEYFDEIFNPFKRLHSSQKYSGTGIGLATCKAIVERHHGKIWVESEPGKGSHFKFILGTL